MVISKGTKCYPSEKGHYNFYYPNLNEVFELTMNIEASLLPWVGYRGYRAFKVVSPKNFLPIKVLWVKE